MKVMEFTYNISILVLFYIDGSQLAKMKRYIPYMSLP